MELPALIAFVVVLMLAVVVALAGWRRLPIRARGDRTAAEPPPDE